MSEQNGTNVSTKPRRSLQTTKQNGTQQTTLQPPTSDDKEQLAYQRKFLPFFVSHLLDFISGYGYRPWLAFRAYVLVIIAFALAYYIIGHKVGPVLSPLGSVVFSMTSFHGRGFFPGGIGLDDPLTVVAALEAFIGLLIEVTFIATLTQRLFGK